MPAQVKANNIHTMKTARVPMLKAQLGYLYGGTGSGSMLGTSPVVSSGVSREKRCTARRQGSGRRFLGGIEVDWIWCMAWRLDVLFAWLLARLPMISRDHGTSL